MAKIEEGEGVLCVRMRRSGGGITQRSSGSGLKWRWIDDIDEDAHSSMGVWSLSPAAPTGGRRRVLQAGQSC